ncbi:MAG: thioesterase family protein, partial [Nitratireductor sp.]
LWQRFDVVSTIETWDGTQIIGQHRFVLQDGRIAAMILTTGGVYDYRGKRFVPMDELMSALGVDTAPRAPNDEEKAFMASHQGLRARAKVLS